MKLKGLGEIRTSRIVLDRRKIGSHHGAYLELSAIALQRQRLAGEMKATDARRRLMTRQLEALERRAALLKRFLDTNDGSVLESLNRSPRRNAEIARRPHRARATREPELQY